MRTVHQNTARCRMAAFFERVHLEVQSVHDFRLYPNLAQDTALIVDFFQRSGQFFFAFGLSSVVRNSFGQG